MELATTRFRVAVLPLDGELSAALLYRGSRKRCAVCGAAFAPKSNRGKYCPDCAPKARDAYRQAHESDFIIAEAAARYFREHGITKLPARKALQAEIEQLISPKDSLYNGYREQKRRFKELQTVKRNIDQILRREEPNRRKEQNHER